MDFPLLDPEEEENHNLVRHNSLVLMTHRLTLLDVASPTLLKQWVLGNLVNLPFCQLLYVA
jgi:hypothetical protein